MPTPSSCDLYRVVIDDPQAQPLLLQVTQRIARILWGSATAYRLGMLSRFTNLDNPFDPGSPRHAMFDNGSMQLVNMNVWINT